VTYTYPAGVAQERGLSSLVTVASSRPNKPILTRTKSFNYYCIGSGSPCPSTTLTGLLYQGIIEPSQPLRYFFMNRFDNVRGAAFNIA
jgi:hypothetical protein